MCKQSHNVYHAISFFFEFPFNIEPFIPKKTLVSGSWSKKNSFRDINEATFFHFPVKNVIGQLRQAN